MAAPFSEIGKKGGRAGFAGKIQIKLGFLMGHPSGDDKQATGYIGLSLRREIWVCNMGL